MAEIVQFADHFGITAQDGAAAGLQKIDILVFVQVRQIGPVSFCKNQWKRVVEGQVVLHAARNDIHGLVDHRF